MTDVSYYLSQASRINSKLKVMSRQLKLLKEAAENISPSIGDMPHSATPNVHRMESVIVKILDLENEMEAEFSKLADIHKTINTLSDPLLQSLVVERYVNDKKWDEVARNLNISSSHVFRLHKAAISELETVIENLVVNDSKMGVKNT